MGSLSINEAFDVFRDEYINYRNQSAKTAEMSKLACKSLISCVGDKYIEDLTFDDVRSWKQRLEYSKSPNTVRGYMIKLRMVLNYLDLKGYKVIKTGLIAVPKRAETPVNYLTAKEVSDLISCVFKAKAGYRKLNRYRNRAIVAVLYASGIRVSELCKMNRFDVRPDGTFTITGKRDKTRLCFLDERAMQYLDEYMILRKDRNTAMFLSHQTSERITKSVVQLIFRQATDKMGYPKPIHPHMLRHSFATNLLANNTNLYYVSKFLGHSSVQTTEHYLHYVDEDLKQVYQSKHTT